MRRPVKQKPLNVKQAKEEADRLANLACASQRQGDEMKEILSSLLDEINETKELKRVAIQEAQQAKEIASAKQVELLGLFDVFNKTTQDVTLIQEKLSIKQKEFNALDEKIKERTVEITKVIHQEIARLNGEVQWMKDDLANVSREKKITEESFISLEKEKERKRNELNILEKETAIQQEQKKSLTQELQSIELAIKTNQEVLFEIPKKQDVLDGLLETCCESKQELSRLDAQIEQRTKEFELFDIRVKEKTDAFRKLEQKIEEKTRRLKAVQDEKGIEKYLRDNDVI